MSYTAEFFDPAGWCAPIIIKAKVLIQQLRLERLGWDDKISQASLDQWNIFVEGLKFREEIRIPRWTHYSPASKVQILGFCDAYCAVVYIRIVSGNKVS